MLKESEFSTINGTTIEGVKEKIIRFGGTGSNGPFAPQGEAPTTPKASVSPKAQVVSARDIQREKCKMTRKYLEKGYKEEAKALALGWFESHELEEMEKFSSMKLTGLGKVVPYASGTDKYGPWVEKMAPWANFQRLLALLVQGGMQEEEARRMFFPVVRGILPVNSRRDRLYVAKEFIRELGALYRKEVKRRSKLEAKKGAA